MISGFGIFAIVLVVLSIVTLFAGVKTVPQGYNWTVERFGKFTRTLQPGLSIIVPYIDRIGRKRNMMEIVLDIERQEVITKDNAVVAVDGVLYFQVFDAQKASYEVSQLEYAIQNLGTTNLRTVMGGKELDALLSERDQINTQLLTTIDAATSPWGVKVTRVEIKDISPSQDLVEAMSAQLKAERMKRAAVLAAEGDRQAAIERAEGEKQAAIKQAEGRLAAAEKDAEARERLAEAEAKATTVVSKAIAEGDVNAINYFVANKYIDSLQTIGSAENSKVVFMPLEASSVIGSVGGISELLKNVKQA
jgi:regulator of protease activity HflC (stomatin/prohibitin superfamily)